MSNFTANVLYFAVYIYGPFQLLYICDYCLKLEYQCHTINEIRWIVISAAMLLPVYSIYVAAPLNTYDLALS